jgi:hypothetical protein
MTNNLWFEFNKKRLTPFFKLHKGLLVNGGLASLDNPGNRTKGIEEC